MLGMLPSRLVTHIDDLEERGLLERRDNPEDRRLYALRLTDQGAKTMTAIGRISHAHDAAICAALSEQERQHLWSFLSRIADEQGLTPGVHPGFALVAGRRRAARQAARPRTVSAKRGRDRP